MERCHGSLAQWLSDSKHGLTENEVLDLFSGILNGVAAAHHKSVILRDIKVENMLLKYEQRQLTSENVRLCDYGSATRQIYSGEILLRDPQVRATAERDIQANTTPQYRAPEMIDLLSRMDITSKADIFALGVCLYRLMYKKLPFPGEALANFNARFEFPDETMQFLRRGKYEEKPDIPSYTRFLKDTVRWCLSQRPEARPSIDQLILHVMMRGEAPTPDIQLTLPQMPTQQAKEDVDKMFGDFVEPERAEPFLGVTKKIEESLFTWAPISNQQGTVSLINTAKVKQKSKMLRGCVKAAYMPSPEQSVESRAPQPLFGEIRSSSPALGSQVYGEALQKQVQYTPHSANVPSAPQPSLPTLYKEMQMQYTPTVAIQDSLASIQWGEFQEACWSGSFDAMQQLFTSGMDFQEFVSAEAPPQEEKEEVVPADTLDALLRDAIVAATYVTEFNFTVAHVEFRYKKFLELISFAQSFYGKFTEEQASRIEDLLGLLYERDQHLVRYPQQQQKEKRLLIRFLGVLQQIIQALVRLNPEKLKSNVQTAISMEKRLIFRAAQLQEWKDTIVDMARQIASLPQ